MREHTNYCTHRLVVKNAAGVVTWEGSAWTPWGNDPRYMRCGLCEKVECRVPTQEAPKHGTAPAHTKPAARRAPRRQQTQGELFEPFQLALLDGQAAGGDA